MINTNSSDVVKGKKMAACPKCGTLNDMHYGVCFRCGSALNSQDSDEPKSAFASGLPEWDIEPPHVMVRRKRRT